jgi:hypothetical protein
VGGFFFLVFLHNSKSRIRLPFLFISILLKTLDLKVVFIAKDRVIFSRARWKKISDGIDQQSAFAESRALTNKIAGCEAIAYR